MSTTDTNTETAANACTYNLERPLLIDINKLNEYKHIKNMLEKNEVPEEHKTAYEVSLMALTSKQCNEPYEALLSSCLGVVNLEEKHGWDAKDKNENPTEFYEYKPSSNKNSPSGTINDDSETKIIKFEKLAEEGKNTWLILAGINKEEFNFSVIYKFPAEIYNLDRRKYLNETIEKNKKSAKQTRITYGINVKKSIELCKKFNKVYYIWRNVVV
jgi:hypothetical protein